MDPCLDKALKLDYLNGTVSEGERALFEGHLAACPACRREIAGLRRTAAAVAGLTPPSVPAAWAAAAKDRLRAKALTAAVAPPGPALRRRSTNVFQYAAIAACVIGGLALLFGLVLGGTARGWLPDLSSILGISGPRTARAVGLVTWILSLQTLLLVPSIIDNVYGLFMRRGRRIRAGSPASPRS